MPVFEVSYLEAADLLTAQLQTEGLKFGNSLVLLDKIEPRDKGAALSFMKRALKRHDAKEAITTGGLRSYKAAMTELGNAENRRKL